MHEERAVTIGNDVGGAGLCAAAADAAEAVGV
jgi:hypothetical protein